jgi:hypothetical protein
MHEFWAILLRLKKICLRLLGLALIGTLPACGGGPVDSKEAQSCIEDAFNRKNNQLGTLTRVLGSPGFMPKVKASKVNIQSCNASGPSTYLCLVEYEITTEGGDGDLNSLIGALRDFSGDTPLQHSYWRFSKAASSFQCERVNM